MKIDFSAYLKKSVQEIEQELVLFSQAWNDEIAKRLPALKKLNENLTDGFSGGKMLRGTLVKLGYELVTEESTKAILQPAAAFEILHTAFLIHDDIIDESLTRRGKPTMHIQNGKGHYGIAQAICQGDLGFTLATKLITESNFPENRKTRALAIFLQNKVDTILGEMLDIEPPEKRDEKLVNDIHLLKTANYTIVGPMTVGAIFGGADNLFLRKVKQFGEPLGLAFQIQDDILGIYGDEKYIGKSTTSDIEEDKTTLLLTYSLENGTKTQKEILQEYYGKREITKTQQEIIKKVFEETGALSYSQKKIENLINEAKTFIPSLTSDANKQALLQQLCDLLLKRKD